MELRIAQEPVNDTMGPYGLVPTLLVYGIIPRLPVLAPDFPDHRSRMRVLQVDRREYASIVEGLRISQPKRSRTPESEKLIINPIDCPGVPLN